MQKTKNSYGLIDLMAINVGSMVGVGIFFKNKGILAESNNIWIALVSWVVGCLAVYGIARAFAEANSVTDRKGMSGTLSNYARLFLGKRVGTIFHQLMSFLVAPIFSILLIYYTVQFAYQAFEINVNSVNWLVTLGIVLGLYAILSLCNMSSYAFGKTFQKAGTFIKFVPLLSVVVLGFFMPAVANNTYNGFVGSPQVIAAAAGKTTQTWKWAALAATLPSVFFALDGFYGGLALSKEEKRKKDATKATLYSVILVSIFYIAFSAAVGFGTTDGNLFTLFENTFGKMGARTLYMFISISAATVANGFMVAGSRQVKTMADEDEFLPIPALKKLTPDGRFYTQTFFIFVVGAIWAFATFIPSKVLGVGIEKVMDEFGNIITMFIFFGYSLITFGVLANRFSKKYEVDKLPHMWLGVVGASVVIVSVVVIIMHNILKIVTEGFISLNAYLIAFGLVFLYVLTLITNLGKGKLDD